MRRTDVQAEPDTAPADTDADRQAATLAGLLASYESPPHHFDELHEPHESHERDESRESREPHQLQRALAPQEPRGSDEPHALNETPHPDAGIVIEQARAWRPHWDAFLRHTGDLSVDALARKQAQVDRQLHENGVTYHVYADADGPPRPWTLDLLPLIIPAAEWEPLAHALRQRARLLNAVAADLYGAQRLLADGLLPPALVFGHPGFLRACHGVQPPRGIFLHQIACDLARGPDGRWWIAGHRTQAPSGAGYALENRMTALRLFPDAFRDLHVHKLALFFRALQEMLLASAPCDDEPPHIVLLTPGPYNETYFEHAYLARYLGFPLVEGGDLLVRDDRVYLKTLSGLQRVHAVLRRLDDDYADPLELRTDSALGVPGLVQAWRAGQVLIANALGTSVLESPALPGFLPALCERLLGEPLAVPSVPTWWCGEAAALDAALPRIDEMVITAAFPGALDRPAGRTSTGAGDRSAGPARGATERRASSRNAPQVVVADLDAAARAAWIDRLRAEPNRFVLEEHVPLSYAPVWQGDRVDSRAVMLRTFLVSDGRGDYTVMPGGLSRVATADTNASEGEPLPPGGLLGGSRRSVAGMMSMQWGGTSKDTWVLSTGPVAQVSLLPGRLRPEDIARSARMVSSRAGENLFWLGRYAERSQNAARLLRAVLARLSDCDACSPTFWSIVVRACHRYGLLRTPHAIYASSPSRLEADLLKEMFEATSVSLAFNVTQTVRAAGSVRDRLSADNWRLLNQLLETLTSGAAATASTMTPADPRSLRDRPTAPHRHNLSDALDLIDTAIVLLVAASGLETGHMTRDDGWRFLSLGRHLERLLYVMATAGEVAASGDSDQPALLEWLLDLSDSTITYRARYMRQPEWLAVADLLLFDRRNPRSAAFQLSRLAKQVSLLPDARGNGAEQHGTDASGADASLTELVAEIDRAAAEGFQLDLFGRAYHLEQFVHVCETLARRLSDALALRYFSHVYERTQATTL